MKHLLLVAVLLASLVGCDELQTQETANLPYFREIPTVNLPVQLREQNWGGGSCVHASTVMILRWQHMEKMADWWRRSYAGGESFNGLTNKLNAAGMKWVGTADGDETYLKWACDTRRGAVIFYKPNHSICLVHLDDRMAGVLDNNHIGRIEYIDRATFIRNWKGYGGVAVTPVYSPTAPLPYLEASL